eukprot:10660586-Karenia_brevis.AAC.1
MDFGVRGAATCPDAAAKRGISVLRRHLWLDSAWIQSCCLCAVLNPGSRTNLQQATGRNCG